LRPGIIRQVDVSSVETRNGCDNTWPHPVAVGAATPLQPVEALEDVLAFVLRDSSVRLASPARTNINAVAQRRTVFISLSNSSQIVDIFSD
jgi:hypothetical protein